jgi:RES domain-containing protein
VRPRLPDGIRIQRLARTVFWQGDPPPTSLRAMVSEEGNRWNDPGEPTVYLAGDLGLTLVEAGRHLAADAEVEPRAIWTARGETDGIVDLCDAELRHTLGLDDELWFLDRGRTRGVAARLRDLDGVAGLIVPSAGSPDDLERTNLVLYADRFTQPLEAILLEPRVVGRIEPEAATT